MAIVPNLALEGDVTDHPLGSPNRFLNGAPNALLTVPQFVGEIVQDLSTGNQWIAAGMANNRWTPYANLG